MTVMVEILLLRADEEERQRLAMPLEKAMTTKNKFLKSNKLLQLDDDSLKKKNKKLSHKKKSFFQQYYFQRCKIYINLYTQQFRQIKAK